jgi:hypothetical protein
MRVLTILTIILLLSACAKKAPEQTGDVQVGTVVAEGKPDDTPTTEQPTPMAKELVIDLNRMMRIGTPADYLHIWIESESARRWIETEAPKFGDLSLIDREDWREQSLRVRRTYDAENVRAYLLNYNLRKK